jgi:hypothetical protein
MASVLRQLSDADLEALHQMIRRDASSDLEIAKFAEEKLSRQAKNSTGLGKTDQSKIMTIHRYRKGKEYARWLKNWENRDSDLRKDLELQKQRFEWLSNVVQAPGEEGMQTLSKSLQARLLALAAQASDEELVEGAAKNGWVKNVIRVIQEQGKMEHKAAGEKVLAVEKDTKIAPEERERRIKEIFGLA